MDVSGATDPVTNANPGPRNTGADSSKQAEEFKEAIDRSTTSNNPTTSNNSPQQSQGSSNWTPFILATRPPINLLGGCGLTWTPPVPSNPPPPSSARPTAPAGPPTEGVELDPLGNAIITGPAGLLNSAGASIGNAFYDAAVSKDPSKIASAVLGEGLKAATDEGKAALQQSVGQAVKAGMKFFFGPTAAAVGGWAASAATGVVTDKVIDAGAEEMVKGPELPSAP